MKYRIEKDTMGEVKVPSDKLWGAQTQRSRNNFKIGPSGSIPLEIIYGFAYLKKAAAYTNCKLGVLDLKKRDLIAEVCDEILEGKHDQQFPLVIWQTGSGTQSNMNINEVIANRAHQLAGKTIGQGEKTIQPNDDVNKSQSSNDTFPTGMHIAAYKKIIELTIPGVEQLRDTLENKAKTFKSLVKIGRTHLMDATPLTLGQEFSGYVSQLNHGLKALQNTLEHLAELALGGTAVGTGLNTPKGYDILVAKYIAEFTGLPFVTAKNKFEALAAHDAIVESHGALKQLAVALNKIANDIRMMASGPRSGIGEITLPANEPGSSIMPGKVNPTQCEALSMVCTQIMGFEYAVSMANSSGTLQMNEYKPLIGFNILTSLKLLKNVIENFRIKLVDGMEPNQKKMKLNLENSLMLVTAIVPKVGYEKAAEIANLAFKESLNLKEATLKLGYLNEDEFDEAMNINSMI